MADDYFRQNFNTALNPTEEADYKLWLVDQAAKRGRDMSQEEGDYDMRGYWKAGNGLDNAQGHFPDTFKKPNHPTFSDESQYHGAKRPDGGKYAGGQWNLNRGIGRWTFSPAPEMFSGGTHTPQAMQQYFQQYEPGSPLKLPQ